jgi:phage terminase Nu1 subunit (DNA packaging protein)
MPDDGADADDMVILLLYKCISTEGMMSTTRWNIGVSADTDQSLRLYLASHGGGRKGDLSRFVEEAVRAHILELTAAQAKAANAHVTESSLADIVEQAVAWARNA